MSKLAQVEPLTSAPTPASSPKVMTSERWVAVVMIGALGFLVVTGRAFREFIPR